MPNETTLLTFEMPSEHTFAHFSENNLADIWNAKRTYFWDLVTFTSHHLKTATHSASSTVRAFSSTYKSSRVKSRSSFRFVSSSKNSLRWMTVFCDSDKPLGIVSRRIEWRKTIKKVCYKTVEDGYVDSAKQWPSSEQHTLSDGYSESNPHVAPGYHKLHTCILRRCSRARPSASWWWTAPGHAQAAPHPPPGPPASQPARLADLARRWKTPNDAVKIAYVYPLIRQSKKRMCIP